MLPQWDRNFRPESAVSPIRLNYAIPCTCGLPRCCHSNLNQHQGCPHSTFCQCGGKRTICNRWIVCNCFAATRTALLVFGAYQACQLWPLTISSAVREKNCRQPQCIDHGYELVPLLGPVLAGPVGLVSNVVWYYQLFMGQLGP